ncbi:NGG1p interacting factor 3 [Imleria badia]|nr:NGG1p interacting factor 3 [Imleria badia]
MPREVRTVAICAGSGGSVLDGVDADVYFTGEMSHHEVLAAVAAGRYVVLCGHTNTERGYLPILASKLSSTLTEFANETLASSQAVPATTLRPHGPSGLSSSVTLTEQERQALRNVQVFVSEADRHPLERM